MNGSSYGTRTAERALARGGHERRRQPFVREARAEAETRDLVVGQPLDQFALGLRPFSWMRSSAAAPPRAATASGPPARCCAHQRTLAFADSWPLASSSPSSAIRLLDSELQLSTRSDCLAQHGAEAPPRFPRTAPPPRSAAGRAVRRVHRGHRSGRSAPAGRARRRGSPATAPRPPRV